MKAECRRRRGSRREAQIRYLQFTCLAIHYLHDHDLLHRATESSHVRGERRIPGRLEDLCVDPSQKARGWLPIWSVRPRRPSVHTYAQIQSISVRAGQTNVSRDEVRCYAPDEGLIRIKKDVLDQQIIDVNNRKVVRVNDVDFDIEPIDGHTRTPDHRGQRGTGGGGAPIASGHDGQAQHPHDHQASSDRDASSGNS